MDRQTNWYCAQQAQINDFALAFGLDEQQTHEFSCFVLGVAREQFKAGNRSGAAWALDQARQKIAKGETV